MLKKLGHYLVLDQLGAGAVGEVYRAQDTRDQSELALKIIKPEQLRDSADPELIRSRFKKEYQISKTLKHRNIIETYEAGIVDGKLFIACELIRGGSLLDTLEKQKKLDRLSVFNYIADILRALSYLEEKGLIHRDVKPGNVLVDENNCAKLADFGLARSTASNRTKFTVPWTTLGTPLYIAPEQIVGNPDLDIRCDLYSTGVLLYQLLTGEPPYTAKSLPLLYKLHKSGPVPDLRDSVPDLPGEIVDLCKRLLAKDREDRPSSPGQVLSCIEPFLNQPTKILEPGFVAPLVELASDRQAKQNETITGNETVVAESRRIPAGTNRARRTPGLKRARLVYPSGKRKKTINIYSQEALQIGRNAVDYQGQDVCLRFLPEDDDEDLSTQISGHHFGVFMHAGRAFIVDYNSANGTQLGGQALESWQPQVLGKRNMAVLSDVLELEILVSSPKKSYNPERSMFGERPTIVIQRTTKRGRLLYVLLGHQLRLTTGKTGKKNTKEPVFFVVRDNDGELSFQSPKLSTVSKLHDGQRIDLGRRTIEVEAF